MQLNVAVSRITVPILAGVSLPAASVILSWHELPLCSVSGTNQGVSGVVVSEMGVETVTLPAVPASLLHEK